MRLYAVFCFIAAMFYGATAIQAISTGAVASLRGNTEKLERRDDPSSQYGRFLLARWILSGGLAAMGVLTIVLAGKFEKLEDANK